MNKVLPHSYHIIWEYQVPLSNRKKFKLAYGPDGSWNKLFAISQHYMGSDLLNHDQREELFILIDNWKDEASYLDFLETHRIAYDQLSLQCGTLYSSEKKIGAFYGV